MHESPVIELRGVQRSFWAGDVEVNALVDADLVVNRGEYLAVMGPSGSGKSTLLNLVGFLDRPTGGTYLFDGINTDALTEGQRAWLRSRNIGFVFQAFHLLSHRSVLENVLMSTIYNGMPRADRIPAAEAALHRVGLGHRIDFSPSSLSGGERQRVAIARAIVTSPALLLCDEPTGNLDSVTGESMLSLFEDLRASGLTLVVVTHDDVISRHAHRLVHMKDGRMESAA